MAHNLTQRADGTAEMAYVGKVPWHGLGAKLDDNASMDDWRKAAGFAHEILDAPVRFMHEGKSYEMDSQRVKYRSDNLKPLSVVSDSYQVVQPAAVMDYFADLAERGGFKLETAGTLFGGKQYWAQASIGAESYVADPKDKIRGNLLMSTSVDRSLATENAFVTTRVVCWNTLQAATGERGNNRVRTSHRTAFNPADVNEQLGITLRSEFDALIEQFRQLASFEMTDVDMVLATLELLKPQHVTLSDEELQALAGSKTAQRIGQLAIEYDAIGADLNGAVGTTWGWLNAVTQFVDHEYAARTDDRRISRAWFGEGAEMKTRAFNMAMQYAEGEDIFAPSANSNTKAIDTLIAA